MKRLTFRVDGLEQDAAGKNVLKLLHAAYPDKIFTTYVSSVRLEKPGPPNQYFVNDSPTTSTRHARRVAGSAAQPVDGEEDVEPIEDAAIDDGDEGNPDAFPPSQGKVYNGPSSDGDWEWSAFFDCIANNARGSHPKHDPSIKNISLQRLKRMNPIDYFNIFMPGGYFWQHVVPSTSAMLQEMGSEETSLRELRIWFGIWFLHSLHPQYSLEDFFYIDAKRKRDDFWNPPKCGKYMPRNRFQKIQQCLCLTTTLHQFTRTSEICWFYFGTIFFNQKITILFFVLLLSSDVGWSEIWSRRSTTIWRQCLIHHGSPALMNPWFPS